MNFFFKKKYKSFKSRKKNFWWLNKINVIFNETDFPFLTRIFHFSPIESNNIHRQREKKQKNSFIFSFSDNRNDLISTRIRSSLVVRFSLLLKKWIFMKTISLKFNSYGKLRVNWSILGNFNWNLMKLFNFKWHGLW